MTVPGQDCCYQLVDDGARSLAALTAGSCTGSGDLFHRSALGLHGPKHPYQSSQSSGGVQSLAVLDDKGLAAGTCTGSIDLFHMSSLDYPRQSCLAISLADMAAMT